MQTMHYYCYFSLQYILSQEISKPLRQTLEAHSLKLVNSTFSIPQVRPICGIEVQFSVFPGTISTVFLWKRS